MVLHYCSTYCSTYDGFRVVFITVVPIMCVCCLRGGCVCFYYCSTYYKAVRVCGGGGMEDMFYERIRAEAGVMMMPFNCSYRNKNEPTAIYPSLGYSPPRKENKQM